MNIVQADLGEQQSAVSSSYSSSYTYSYSILGHPCSGYTDAEMYAGSNRWAQVLENE